MDFMVSTLRSDTKHLFLSKARNIFSIFRRIFMKMFILNCQGGGEIISHLPLKPATHVIMYMRNIELNVTSK